MFQMSHPRSLIAFAAFCFAIALPRAATATIVEFETNIGTFEVNLYDLDTPATVANFLAYVNNGAYTDSFIHRVDPGFVVQGGGYVTDVNANVTAIPQNAPVTNEPVFSNVRGTIAMAKVGGNANSATSQWFFNLSNNAANLDNQNGGFTVFGQVTGNGMTTVDAIAAVPIYNVSGTFPELPLQNYTPGNQVQVSNLVVITQITVIDTTVDSAGVAGLNPPLSTRNSGGNGGGGGGGGGSLGWLALLCLSAIGGRRYRLAKAA